MSGLFSVQDGKVTSITFPNLFKNIMRIYTKKYVKIKNVDTHLFYT